MITRARGRTAVSLYVSVWALSGPVRWYFDYFVSSNKSIKWEHNQMNPYEEYRLIRELIYDGASGFIA